MSESIIPDSEYFSYIENTLVSVFEYQKSAKEFEDSSSSDDIEDIPIYQLLESKNEKEKIWSKPKIVQTPAIMFNERTGVPDHISKLKTPS
ncbi:hypothetical protein BB559_006136, partial [Furculomyces boomerangus]